jgi:hypothetical protein
LLEERSAKGLFLGIDPADSAKGLFLGIDPADYKGLDLQSKVSYVARTVKVFDG